MPLLNPLLVEGAKHLENNDLYVLVVLPREASTIPWADPKEDKVYRILPSLSQHEILLPEGLGGKEDSLRKEYKIVYCIGESQCVK